MIKENKEKEKNRDSLASKLEKVVKNSPVKEK